MGTPVFDELIHPSTRLSIVAILASTDWAEFSFVRDRLELSDSALSKQFATLEEAGYVTIERPLSEHRRRVRVALHGHGTTGVRGARRGIAGGHRRRRTHERLTKTIQSRREPARWGQRRLGTTLVHHEHRRYNILSFATRVAALDVVAREEFQTSCNRRV